jgi:hypothetical protein
MERQSKGSRGLETYCKGGQDPPRAVAPLKKMASVVPNLWSYKPGIFNARLSEVLQTCRSSTQILYSEFWIKSDKHATPIEETSIPT